jgi:hypothetical protein
MHSDQGGRHRGALRKFFQNFVWRRFFEDIRLGEPRIALYVTDLLADFAHTDSLYRIQNAFGRRLDDVGEMLIESHPMLEASSFGRERAVRKHVGDYTLFMTGLFPEYVANLHQARHPRLGAFVDFMKAGKESYAIVASFDQFEYRGEAPLFRRLSDNFEQCVVGLNLVKKDLQELQRDYYRSMSQILHL